jgi:hypothetical protein
MKLLISSIQYLLSHARRELAIVREIDSLEEELLDMLNHNGLGGDNICCDIHVRPILKRPFNSSPSEYHSQLKDYITLYSRQLPPRNLRTTTNDSNSKTTFDHLSRNTDDIVITIVTK